MICLECNGKMKAGRGDHRFVESGLDFVWLRNWPIYTCLECGEPSAILPDSDSFAQAILPHLLTRESAFDRRCVRFLRSEFRMTSQMLADAVGVHRVEVSRWENGSSRIDPYHDFRLRMEAVERLLPKELRDAAKVRISSIFHRSYRRGARSVPLYLTPPLRMDSHAFSSR